MPLCEGETTSYEAPWLNFTIPESDSNNFLKEEDDLAKCKMYRAVPGSTKCERDSFDTNSTVPCDRFVYDTSVFDETAVTVLDLVCENSYKATFQDTVLMLGLLAGSLIGGPLTDKIGRKKTLVIATGIIGPSTIIGGFAQDYVAFSFFRFAAITGISVKWIAKHTLLMELFDSKWRKLAYIISVAFYTPASLIKPLIAYLERDWKYMHLWAGLVALATLPLMAFCLLESIRWQILNGQEENARKLLLSVARINKGKELEEDASSEIERTIKAMAHKHSSSEGNPGNGKLSPRDMLRKRFILRTLVTQSIWITAVVSFYAISLNATKLPGDVFLNNVYGILSELPSMLMTYLLISLLGRRLAMVIALLISGVSIVTMAFVSKSHTTVILALWLIGRIGSACVMNVVWYYTAEIYPTNLRAQAIATCSVIARIFGAITPFITSLNDYGEMIPFLVIGLPVVAAGLAAIALPETKGQTLPDGMETDGEGSLAHRNTD